MGVFPSRRSCRRDPPGPHSVNLFDTAWGYGFGASDGYSPRRVTTSFARCRHRHQGRSAPRRYRAIRARPGYAEASTRPRHARCRLPRSLPDSLARPRCRSQSRRRAQELIGEGKIRHVGVSNFDVDQITSSTGPGPSRHCPVADHLFRQGRSHGCCRSVPSTRSGARVRATARALSGRLDEHTTFTPDDWRSLSPAFHGEPFVRNLDAVPRCNGCGRSRATVVSSPLPACSAIGRSIWPSSAHARTVTDAVAAGLVLSATDRSLVDAVMAYAVPVGGPTPEAMP